MKILFVNSGCHRKNLNFILKCKNIFFHIINSASEIDNLDVNTYDCIYSPCVPIDVSKYPNTKFIFGPHFSVFPDNKLNLIKSPKTVYNSLSDWVVNIWSTDLLCNDLKVIKMPFGVETEKFTNIKSINERQNVILYFKHRNPNELSEIESFLKQKLINYTLFSYDKKYDEKYYLEYLQNTKYAIWVDAHESQGFALQEALSCNVPLLVWNVKSMSQEYNANYSEKLKATTIPYWDERCGEFFYEKEEFEEKFNLFISKLETYNPREYILENLSIEVRENKLIEFIENM